MVGFIVGVRLDTTKEHNNWPRRELRRAAEVLRVVWCVVHALGNGWTCWGRQLPRQNGGKTRRGSWRRDLEEGEGYPG